MPITITTWNVRNFARSQPVFDEKLNLLIGTLPALGSDVVAPGNLGPKRAPGPRERPRIQHFAGTPDSRGNRVAFLTRQATTGRLKRSTGGSLRKVSMFAISTIRAMSRLCRTSLDRPLPLPTLGREIDVATVQMKSKLLTFGASFSTSKCVPCRPSNAVCFVKIWWQLIIGKSFDL